MLRSPSLEKSTTRRAKLPVGFRVARGALLGLEAVAPALAAGVATRWMFRTQRRAPEPWERDVTSRAERLTLDGPSGPLAVYRWGNGPLVLLVHGWNGRAGQLGAFVAPLVSAGFEVVAFDAPGHGASRGSRSSIVEFASAFERVVDEVRPFFRPVHGVIAHSMGGSAVALALGRSGARRRSSEGREGQEVGAGGEPSPTRLVFFAPPIDVRAFSAQFSSALGLGRHTQEAIDRAVERQLGTRLDDLQALRMAGTVRAPLLILHDEDDRAVPLESGRRLADAWLGAELGVTRGLGHSRILRDPSSVERAVAFIRSSRVHRENEP
jgi:pimeloyl-ACP methyl ester carboxylesterase